MFCTVMPLMRASGLMRLTRCIMSLKALRTASPLCKFSATPPTSDLCVMSGESIFSATGKPCWVAIIIASWALRASKVRVTGM